MAHNKLYRNFIILQEDERGYSNSNDKALSGYAKIEAKGDKCKVSFYAQNLRQEDNYSMVLICCKRDLKQLIDLGPLSINRIGKGDTSKEYYVNNIAGLGISYEKISGAAICKVKDNETEFIMHGFMNGEDSVDNWRKFKIVKSDSKKYINKFDEESRRKDIFKPSMSDKGIVSKSNVVETKSVETSKIEDELSEKFIGEDRNKCKDVNKCGCFKESEKCCKSEFNEDIEEAIKKLGKKLDTYDGVIDLKINNLHEDTIMIYGFIKHKKDNECKWQKFKVEKKCRQESKDLNEVGTEYRRDRLDLMDFDKYENNIKPSKLESTSEKTPIAEINVVIEVPSKETNVMKEVPPEETTLVKEIPSEETNVMTETPPKETTMGQEIPPQETPPPEEVPVQKLTMKEETPPQGTATAQETTPPAEEVPPLTAETVPPKEEVPPPTTETTTLAGEVPPPTTETTPPVGEVPPPTTETTPPAEEVPPLTAETTPPAEEVPPPTTETTPPQEIPPESVSMKEETPLGEFTMKGEISLYFEKLAEDFKPYKGNLTDINYCKLYKVDVNSIEDLCDETNYNKYTLAYYPMLNYYPYISKSGYFILGYKCNRNGEIQYIVYGIPGSKDKDDQPYGGRTGFVTWTSDDNNNDNGYWLMFYDFKNSSIVIPTR